MKLLSLALLICMSSVANADIRNLPSSIAIFTTHESGVSFLDETRRNGVQVDVYYMDTIPYMEAKLSEGLPTTQREAEKVAARRLAKYAKNIEKRIAKLSEGMNVYQYYGMDSFPSAVINSCYFSYGITDLREVVRQWRSAGACR